MAVCLYAVAAFAGPIDYWPIDEGSGGTTYNAIAGRADGTLTNNPLWVDDPVRGMCLSFNGSNQYVAAGMLQALALSDDFSWSFWAYQDQDANNDVILGNRYGGTGSPLQFVKFTPSKFEYYHGSLYGVDYADIPRGTWIHHVVVKDGGALTYYRNGVLSATATISFNEDQNPLYFGGDSGGECWQGMIDDVSLWDRALTPNEVLALSRGVSPLAIPEPATLALLAAGCLALARRRRRAS